PRGPTTKLDGRDEDRRALARPNFPRSDGCEVGACGHPPTAARKAPAEGTRSMPARSRSTAAMAATSTHLRGSQLVTSQEDAGDEPGATGFGSPMKMGYLIPGMTPTHAVGAIA